MAGHHRERPRGRRQDAGRARAVEVIRIGGKRYEVLEEMGGPRSGVIKARKSYGRHGRTVAIRWREQGAGIELRILELARRGNPHLPEVLDYARHGGREYVVLPWLSGPTLEYTLDQARRGKERFRFSPEAAYEAGRSLLLGLSRLHRLGVIHGDIKPPNLIVTSNPPRLTPIDFGVSWTSSRTRTRQRKASRYYGAPEQVGLLSEHPLGELSDQFSVGVVLYEAITMSRPYSGLGSDVMLRRSTPPQPESVRDRARCWKSFAEVLRRAVAINPDDRFPTTDGFLDAYCKAAPSRRWARLSGFEWKLAGWWRDWRKRVGK